MIGDIHGCLKTLKALLEAISFDPCSDHLYLVGDIVGKGPDSLGVLRWAFEQQSSVEMVLGNHDLHLIRRYLGLREAKESDNLEEVLAAPEISTLIEWLSRRPLFLATGSFQVIHAGILPHWSPKQVGKAAAKAQKALRKAPYPTLKRAGERIQASRNGLAEFALKVFTSLRCCDSKGEPNFDYTGPPDSAPEGLRPWYSFSEIESRSTTFLFGHWARHGIGGATHAICLDTSCVYGGMLTALRLPDQQLIQVPNQESVADTDSAS